MNVDRVKPGLGLHVCTCRMD